MKRLFSIMLTMAMIIGMVAVPNIGASAATTDPIFDLYFEGYDGTADTTDEIMNGVAGNTSVVTVTNTPGLVTETINGKEVKSLQISDISTGTTRNMGYLKVEDAIFEASNNLTIETWFKWNPLIASNNWNHGNVFNITNGDQSAFKQSMQLKVFGNGDTDTTLNGDAWGTGAKTNWLHKAYANKWIHYVLTREYNASKTEWTTTQYINGVQLNQQWRQDSLKTQEDENFFMMIGYNLDPSKNTEYQKWFHGNIGSFKVYDYALPAATVDANFREEQSNWLNEIDGHVVQLDLSDYTDSSYYYLKNKENKWGLRNAIEGNTTNFSFPNTSSSSNAKPELVVENTPYGERRYMRFSNKDNQNPIGSVYMTDPSMMGEDELTIETWFKWEYNASTTIGNLLRITGASDAEATNTLKVMDNSGSLFFRPYGNQSNSGTTLSAVNYKAEYPTWNHLAITRKYDKTAKVWRARVYLNGVQLGGDIGYSTGDEANYLLEDNTYTMALGRGNGNWWFRGSLGTLDVWNVARDAETIKASYNESKALWQADVNSVSLANLKFSDGENILGSINENTTKVTASFKIGNGTGAAISPIAVLAYYEGDKLVKAAINNEIGSVASSGNTGDTPVEVSLTGLVPAENSKVKLFIWDGTTLAPLMDVDSGMKLDFTPSL